LARLGNHLLPNFDQILNTGPMLFYISAFTILISLVLLYHNWKTNRNAIYLAFLFILTSIFGLGHYFMTNGGSRFWLAIFFNHFAPFMFLIGPFLYFYVRNTLFDTATVCKKDCFHSIPAIISFVGSLGYYFQPFDQKLIIADRILANLDVIRTINVNYLYDIGQSFALRCFFALAYLIYCIYLLYKSSQLGINQTQVPRKQFLLTYQWLIIFLTSLLFIFVSFTMLALNSIDSVPSKTLKDGYVLYLIAGIAYCIMSFSLLIFPEILYGIPKKTFVNTAKKVEIKKIDIREDPFYDLYDSILKYLEEEKPFLDSDFAISDIALYLKVPQNHVSYCVNSLIEKKFSKLKRELRIKHAIALLEKGANSYITIEAISEKSGFETRSNFYKAFKEETGYTPSEYVERLL
jgi:AraC-like DNA-binding protein